MPIFASAPTSDLGHLVFFSAIRDFLLDDDGLVTRWTAGMAERVVALALALVAQDFVGLVDFLEFLFRGLLLLVAGLEVGMWPV